MKFCPKCKALMLPKKSGSKVVMICRGCNFTEDKSEITTLKEEVKDKNKIEVRESSDEDLPITKEKCEKCGNEEAYYWLVQTRAADESETKFLRCTKCEHTWRDYS